MRRGCLAVLFCALVVGVLLGQRPMGSAGAVGSLGFLEVCKAAEGDGVTGSFRFEVAGRSLLVPAGACSAAVQLPAGEVTITELAAPGVSVVGVATTPGDRLVRADLPGRTATVRIVAGDLAAETIVIFTNRFTTGVLKVCKVAGSGVAQGRGFTFDVDGHAVSVPAGPAPDGLCAIGGAFPVGSHVTVTEAVPGGMRVSGIDVIPAARAVGSPDLGGGRATVAIGEGTSVVRFTNQVLPSSTVLLPTTTTTITSALTSVPPTTSPPTTSPPTSRPPTSVPPTTSPPTTSPPTSRPPTSVPPTTSPPTTSPPTTSPPTTAPFTTVPLTTVPPTTAPPTTSPPTTLPPTTAPPTTLPPTTSPPTSSPPSTVAQVTSTTTAIQATTTLPPTTAPSPTTLPGLTTTTPPTTTPPTTTPPTTVPATATTTRPTTTTTRPTTTAPPSSTATSAPPPGGVSPGSQPRSQPGIEGALASGVSRGSFAMTGGPLGMRAGVALGAVLLGCLLLFAGSQPRARTWRGESPVVPAGGLRAAPDGAGRPGDARPPYRVTSAAGCARPLAGFGLANPPRRPQLAVTGLA